MAVTSSLRGFAIGALIMEVFFAIIFALTQGYSPNMSMLDLNGLLTTFYLIFLLLIGFGLVTTYLKNFSLGGLTLTFIMLAFTFRWYFLMKNFWISVYLPDPNGTYTRLGWYFNMIKLNNDNYFWSNTMVTEVTLNNAVACAITMFVAMFPLFGRIGPLEVLFLCFIGEFFYVLNEQVFFRLQICDNGFGTRIFFFGSTMGLIASMILGKKQLTINNPNYYSRYNFQTFGLLGAIFVWILIPWLSVIDQGSNLLNYNQIAPLNIWYALSSSAIASFIVSIWMKGKIAVHDIIFSCFSGAIAYGASSNVYPHPWTGQLIGFIVGGIVTFLNTGHKIQLNENGVLDSLGSFYLFFVPSLIGGIYSSILFAAGAQGPDYSGNSQASRVHTRYQQGGYQLAGIAIAFLISGATGSLIGVLFKCINPNSEATEFFDDGHYIQKDDELVMRRSKLVG